MASRSMGQGADKGHRRKPAGRRKRRLKAGKVALFSAVVVLAVLVLSKDTLLTALIPYVDEILYHCLEAEEDPALILAVIQTESRFRAEVVSNVGAVGLMQVMPDTARWVAGQLALEDYAEEKLVERAWNLRIGIAYMRYLKEQFPDNLPVAVAAYNAGPARVRAWLDTGEWDGTQDRVDDIPFRETREYVKKVLRLYKEYSKNIKI